MNTHNKNILLIEDNPGDERLIREMFISRDLKQYTLHWVENLNEAISFLDNNEVEIILSDLSLPDSRGIETAQILLNKYQTIPIIVLTGVNDIATATRVVRMGAEDFLSKPRLNDYILSRAISSAIERKKIKIKLQRSEEQFRSLYDNSTIGLYRTTPDGKILIANKKIVEMLGFDSFEELAQRNLELNGFNSDDSRRQFHKQMAEIGEVHGFETSWKKKDGSTVFIRESAKAIRDEHNKIIYYDGTIEDITIQKLVELELKESEEQYRVVTNSLNDAIVVIDQESRIMVFVNEAIDGILGYKTHELLGKEMTMLMPSRLREKHKQAVLQYAVSNIRSTDWKAVEFPGLHKDGREVPLEISYGEFSKAGKKYFVGVMRNISDRKQVEAELRLSQERYKNIFKNVQDIFYQTDNNGFLIEVSPSIEKHSGYTVEEVIYKHASFFYNNPEDRDLILKLLHENGEVNDFETQMKTKNGEAVYVSMSSHYTYDDKKNITGVEGVLRNISNRKKLQEELIESEAKFRTLSETTSSAIFMFTGEKIIYANPACEVLSGYNYSELKEMDFWQIIHPDFKEKVKERGFARQRGDAVPLRYEVKIVRKNGEERWIDFSAGIINFEGKVTVLGTAFDITERKNSELSLAESENKFRILSETAASAIFIYKGSNFIYTNPAGEMITGYTSAELYDKHFWDIVHPDHQEMIKERGIARQRGEEIPNRYEFKIVRKDGEVRWVDFTAGKIMYGGSPAALGTAFDITDRKLTEQILHDQSKLLSNVISALPVGLWIMNKEGKIIHGNPAGQKIWAGAKYVSVDQFGEYKGWWLNTGELIKPEEWAAARAITKKETSLNEEIEIECFDGTRKIILNSALPIINSRGEVDAAIIINVDITELKQAELAIKKSEKKYKKFFDDDLSGNFKSTPDGKITMCNNSFVKILGCESIEQVLEMNAFQLYPERKNRNEFLNELKEKKRIEGFETTLVACDGRLIYIVENVIGVFHDDGELKEIVGYIFDITNIKKAEKALIDSEFRYRQLFNSNPQPMWVYDIDTLSFLAVNDAAIEHYGYSREDFLNMTIKDIRPKEDIQKLMNSIKFVDGVDHAGTWRHIKKDGSLIHVNIISHNLMFDGKKADLILATDVTEKLKIEEEVQKLSSAVNQSSVSIIITDIDGNIEYANPFFTKLTGYELEEVLGKNPRLLNTGYHDQYLYSQLWNTILSGKIWRGEMFNKKKNGETYWANSVISPIFNSEGKITHFVAIEEDITEKKKLLEDLIIAKDKAEEMNRVKSYFFANMSHELRTPFVGILGFAELLQDTLVNNDDKEMVDRIIVSSKRMQDTLTKILDVTNLEFSETRTYNNELNIDNVLEKVYSTFLPAATNKNLTLKLNLQFNSLKINSDERLLVGILNNLVDNAIKYTERGEIEIIAKAENDRLIIRVKDSGMGIPEDKHELIFTEFRQVSEGLDRAFEGTGLGLTVAQKFAKLLGGEILVESKVDRGSTFTLDIPIAGNGGRGKDVSKIEIEKSGGLPKRAHSAKKILYVEDDQINAGVVKLFLSKYYNIDVVESVDHSLVKLKDEKYNLLLLDIHLGQGVSGVELIQFLNRDNYYKKIPKVAVTAFAGKEEREFFLSIGLDDLITKPFRLRDLLSVVDQLIKK